MSRSDQAGTGQAPRPISVLLTAWLQETASIPASAELPARHVDDRRDLLAAVVSGADREGDDREGDDRDAAAARLGAVLAGHYTPDEVVVDLAGLQLALLTYHLPVDVGPLTRVMMRAYTVEQDTFALLASMTDPLTELDTFNSLANTLWQLRGTAMLLLVGSATDVAPSRRGPGSDRRLAAVAALRETGELRAACVLTGGEVLAVADSPAIAAAVVERLRTKGLTAQTHLVPEGTRESYARWLVSFTAGGTGPVCPGWASH